MHHSNELYPLYALLSQELQQQKPLRDECIFLATLTKKCTNLIRRVSILRKTKLIINSLTALHAQKQDKNMLHGRRKDISKVVDTATDKAAIEMDRLDGRSRCCW